MLSSQALSSATAYLRKSGFERESIGIESNTSTAVKHVDRDDRRRREEVNIPENDGLKPRRVARLLGYSDGG